MKALVLAGGFPQIALINELKSRGIEVLLADWNEEPVAKKYADKYFRVSTLDVDAIRSVAVLEKVDFLITVCTDQALHTVAKVSEDLGLPCYIDYETALNVTNKQYMKKVFTENGIPTAKHIILDELCFDSISDFRFPLIVKPVDCNSSKGVLKVTDREQLSLAFDNAKRLSRTHTAIIEEFIEGTELTVDAYIEGGKANVLSISVSEKIRDNEKFVIFRTLNPATVSKELEAQIENTVQKIADSFGLTDSPMLVQMLSDGRYAYVIEFSARTGGGVKYLLIQKASGFDVIKAVVDLTLGIKPHAEKKARKYKYLVNDFVYCKPGIFDRLCGFEALCEKGVISDWYPFKWQGAVFDGISNSGDRVCGYTVEDDDIEVLCEKQKKVNECFRVLDKDGNDMARHDLLVPISRW